MDAVHRIFERIRSEKEHQHTEIKPLWQFSYVLVGLSKVPKTDIYAMMPRGIGSSWFATLPPYFHNTEVGRSQIMLDIDK